MCSHFLSKRDGMAKFRMCSHFLAKCDGMAKFRMCSHFLVKCDGMAKFRMCSHFLVKCDGMAGSVKLYQNAPASSIVVGQLYFPKNMQVHKKLDFWSINSDFIWPFLSAK